jgi:hypothetical protein
MVDNTRRPLSFEEFGLLYNMKPLPSRIQSVVFPGTVISQEYQQRTGVRGGIAVKALRYKPTGRGFHSRWCHWNFSVT